MKPKHRNRRLARVALVAIPVAIGAMLLIIALQANTLYFHNPSEVMDANFEPRSERFRVGGLVEPTSIKGQGGLTVEFSVFDFEDAPEGVAPLPVTYTGVLPNLFGPGEGVVLKGTLQEDGVFLAEEVLAKHDENYQPKMPSKPSANQSGEY